MAISKMGIKLFRGYDLQLLEEEVNEFCERKWIYRIEMQVENKQTTIMVMYRSEGGL